MNERSFPSRSHLPPFFLSLYEVPVFDLGMCVVFLTSVCGLLVFSPRSLIESFPPLSLVYCDDLFKMIFITRFRVGLAYLSNSRSFYL